MVVLATSLTELWELIDTLEELLSEPALGLRLLDPLTSPRTNPAHYVDRGAGVTRMRSDNLDDYRGKDRYRMEDEIRILITWRIKPKDQKKARDDCYRKIRDVRKAVTFLGFKRRWCPTLQSESEVVDPAGEWLIMDMRWTFVRDVAVGTG